MLLINPLGLTASSYSFDVLRAIHITYARRVYILLTLHTYYNTVTLVHIN